MVWVKLDDHFDEHPKIVSVGPLGMALWVTGLAYCNRNLTDGFIPTAIALRMLTLEFPHPEDEDECTVLLGGSRGDDSDGQIGFIPDRYFVPNMLVAAGLWERVSGGYRVHDFTEYQPSKAEVQAEREQKRAAGKAGGQASAQARAQAKRNDLASRESTDRQAESNPVPVPVPVPESVIPFQKPEPREEAAAARDPMEEDPNDFSEAISRMCREWERATGTTVTAMLADQFESALARFPEDWVADAIRETGEANVKTWKYTKAILDRWAREGREVEPEPPDPVSKFREGHERWQKAATAWKEANG
jgi:DnaD/phage-associated family protein